PLVGVGHPLSLRSRPRPGICAEYSPNFQLVPIRQRSRDGRGRMHASAAFAYARWDYGRVGGAQGGLAPGLGLGGGVRPRSPPVPGAQPRPPWRAPRPFASLATRARRAAPPLAGRL